MLRQHRFLIPAIIFIMILIAIGGGWWLSLPRGDELPASIRIQPSSQEESGIMPDAFFNLTAEFSVGETTLKGMLELDPAINYTLSGGGKEWQLKPVMPLKENTVYTFRVKNQSGMPVQSFAFQTRSDLLVNSAYPGNQESYVDLNTGIEIRFNRPGVDLSQGFEILPPISGRFETQEYSCRFIPDKPLEYNSIYRITLKNLKSADGAVLKEPYIFSFETMEEEGKESWNDLSVNSFAVSFLPGDSLQVSLNGGEKQAAGTYSMTLHKYPGINAYANVLREQGAFYREQYGVKESYQASTDGLDEVMNVEGKLNNTERGLFAPLPEDLSEGYYLFTLSGTGATDGEGHTKEQFVQQMIQVVNLSVYSQSTNGSTLFWLGDPVTKSPAAEASVELELESGEKVSGQTDVNGLATLSTGENTWAYAMVIREGTPVWFSNLSLSSTGKQEDTPLSRSYYAALYTDRELYLPGDAIHFWGVVKPRADQPMPETVQAGLGTRWPKSALSGITVNVKPDGTFSGVLKPDTLKAGGYLLSIGDGTEGTYLDRYVQISEYTKPAYRITLETDKEFYYFGDTVTFSVSAEYFDGTPAAGAKLLAECYETRMDRQPITLDSNGKATFTGRLDPSTIQPGEGRVAEWSPRSVSWSVRNADEQSVNLSQWDSFQALPSKIVADIQYQPGGALTIYTAALDETKLNDEQIWDAIPTEQLSPEFLRLRGVPVDIPITLVVHKVTSRQVQTGSWYDYVNKQTVPVYETAEEETVERAIPVTTSAGKGTVDELPVAESDDIRYWYEIRFAGGVYGDVCATAYPVRYYRSDPEYTFFAQNNYRTVAPGESLDVAVYKDGVKVSGKMLYTLLQDEMISKGVVDDGTTLTMEPDYLPNVWLAGAYFDGRAIYAIQRANLSYDYSAKTLALEVETSKEDYRPGDEMTVTLTVTNEEGVPVNGRAVVGAVDEAIFALAEQRVNLAGQLYQDIYYPSIVVGSSQKGRAYWEKALANTGGSGQEAAADMSLRSANTGGGVEMRTVFADTADFQTVDVANGKAIVTLTLPDNVTSWRITAAAVTPELQAGDTITAASATLPFYLQPIVSDTYLVGDDISVSALAVGTALATGDVEYTVSIQEAMGIQEAKELTVTKAAGSRAAFNFGQLPAGAYRVRITAAYGEHADAMELPLTVVETGLLVPSLETMDLTELSSVTSERWPVEVTVYDETAKPLFDALSWLSAQDGRRTEMVVASARAMELYNELRPADQRENRPRDKRLDTIFRDDGGVILLPGGESDPAVTAKLLMAAPEVLHEGEAIQYLQNVLKDASSTADDRIMAYVGLAAAKQPVLLDLRRLYEQEGAEMKPYLRMYVGAAFARMGDFDKAKELYDTVKTVRAGDLYHIDDGDIIQATASALLLATEASLDDADGLAKYLMAQNPDPRKGETLYHLELLAYSKSKVGAASGTGKFSYHDGSQNRVVELENGVAALSLDSAALKGKFRSLSGSLYAAAKVLRPGQGESTGDFALVTKTYEPVDSSLTPGGQVKVTVRVKFNEDAPRGVYELSDYIPSGLRWLGGEQVAYPTNRSIWPVLEQDGQRINGSIYRLGNDEVPLERVNGAYVRTLAESVDFRESEESDVASSASSSEATDTPSIVEVESDPAPETPAASSAEARDEIQEEIEEIEDVEPVNPDTAQTDGENPQDNTEVPVPDHAPANPGKYRPIQPASPQDPNEFVFQYYLSAALPGSFVTESVWVTLEGQAIKSDRGIITVNE